MIDANASPQNSREYASDDPKLPEFVAWVSAADRDAWLYFLCECGLNAHLARFYSSSPFDNCTHATNRMFGLIWKFLGADQDRGLEFNWALRRYIHDQKLIQQHFKYHPPEEVPGPKKDPG
jgi:hypothetical protein